MILNFDQTPVGSNSPNNTNYTDKGYESVRITNVNEKREITVAFCVSLSAEFLPIQLIYDELTSTCHPRSKFHNLFHITHSNNHYSNEKIIVLFT